METIAKGKFVEVAYKIMILEGDEEIMIYEFTKQRPDRFVFGHEPGMLEAFTRNLEGLKAGDSFNFTLSPADAFGEIDPSMVQKLERSLFEVDGEFDAKRVFKGAVVPMLTGDGMRIEGIVTEITPSHVTIDFNHQLAGQTVKYCGEVLVVRDATQEELNPPRRQGCGGCGGGCEGGDCGSGCGDGCGSDCAGCGE